MNKLKEIKISITLKSDSETFTVSKGDNIKVKIKENSKNKIVNERLNIKENVVYGGKITHIYLHQITIDYWINIYIDDIDEFEIY